MIEQFSKLQKSLSPIDFLSLHTVAQRQQLRTLTYYSCLLVAGTCLSWFSISIEWQAFGLGLIIPGGAYVLFLAGDTHQIVWHLAIFAASSSLFGFAIFLWFATGNIIAFPLIWLLLAVIGGFSGHFGTHDMHSPAIWENARLYLPGLVVMFLVVSGVLVCRNRKPHLIAQADNGGTIFPTFDTAYEVKEELDRDDIARLCFLLDRALQPIEEFQGFEWIDQFQSAAIRYQLNFAGYALAIIQHCHVPAFKGYMVDAQANLIEKQRNARVWNYWRLENLWGNLRLDGNPFKQDNIMYSGFCATQIAMFQAASGDHRFSQIDSFSLTSTNGDTWNSDFHQLTANLEKQHAFSPYGLIACEPNWVFPGCNSIGFVALKYQQTQSVSKFWNKQAARLKQLLQTEFMNEKGRFIPCRSSRTGFVLPLVGGILAELLPSYFLNATFPDIAKSNWQILRPRILKNTGGSTGVDLKAFWPIDVGNYRFTHNASLAGAAAVAAELGDSEARDILLKRADQLYPLITKDGIAHRKHASIWAHSMELIARCTYPDALRDLVTLNRCHDGPHIAYCKYPDVLVAMAKTDGITLEAVLYPGGSDPAPQTIRVGGLIPDIKYNCSITGLSFHASPEGKAEIILSLSGRTEIVLQPVKENHQWPAA
ncbi:MAG: hypothetical protein GY742_02155 [Hyphomicrobiales bacterium]|nr:hypothetical protein [Hyphomicrobiales bacterium]